MPHAKTSWVVTSISNGEPLPPSDFAVAATRPTYGCPWRCNFKSQNVMCLSSAACPCALALQTLLLMHM